MSSAQDRLTQILSALPPEDLFDGHTPLISPASFPIPTHFAEELDRLGYRLTLFLRACNLLYQQSLRGKQPAWIADYLDRGKPAPIREASRAREFRDDLPLLLQPQLILTDSGCTLVSLNSPPSIIPIIAWLNQTFAPLGDDILGGPTGIIDGLRSILPGGADILIPDSPPSHRPAMQWLAQQAGPTYLVRTTADPLSTPAAPRDIFRAFPLSDSSIPSSVESLIQLARAGALRVTPPFKPFLDEKMWFALFWLRPLRDFWRRELSERQFLKLQQVIPYTWLLDPTPLPGHAVIPHLEIHAWEELKHFPPDQLNLILTPSAPTEPPSAQLAAHLPQPEWATSLQRALDTFPTHPHILQRFHPARLIDHPYRAPDGRILSMQGRVRLTPTYFTFDSHTHLRGALAAIHLAADNLLQSPQAAVILTPTRVEP